jgi:hypothetical protein
METEDQGPKVETTHPAYDRIIGIIRKVRDVIEGEPAILDKEKIQTYLPPPPGMRPSPGETISETLSNKRQSRYAFYVTFADFPEITAPMIQGIMGLIHEKPPEWTLPEKLKYLEKRATGDGDSLVELWQLVTQELFYTGRIGLLADVRGGLGTQGAEMHLCQYFAESIRNWRLYQKCEGGAPNMVVLGESGMEADPADDFQHISVMRFRELRISPETGEYWVRVWSKKENGKVEPVVGPDTNPEGWVRPEIFGKGFLEIPLTVINATDIGYEYGPVPAWPMAKRALAIFRKSADANRGLYIKGDPQAWITGVAEEDIPTEIGGSTIWGLPDSEAKVGYLDIDGQGIPLKQVSVKALVTNAGNGLQEALRMIGRLSGLADGEVEQITFNPNVNFTEGQMGYQELLFLMQAKDLAIRNGVPLSNETLHAQMRKRQLTNLTYEQELAGSEEDIDVAFGLLGRMRDETGVSQSNTTGTGPAQ